MSNKIRSTLVLCTLVLLLASCSQADAEGKTPIPPTPTESVVAPPADAGPGAREDVVAQAVADLQSRLEVSADAVTVQQVTDAEFSDASLGVPEPGKVYAQAITPGYVIRLAVGEKTYIYHGSRERVVLAAQETSRVIVVPGEVPAGTVTVEGVQFSSGQVLIEGSSTFPDGTTIQTELLADGQGATWWPESAYARVQDGVWQVTVVPDSIALDREIEYIVYAWAEGDDSSRTAFPFDLEGPPNAPEPSAPGESSYERITLGDSGLDAQVPVGWLRVGPEWVWTPAEESGLLLGVRWVDLQPPQEAESVLLPQHAQIVQSEDIDLAWGSGRLFTVEVFGSASQGNDTQASVHSVEMHAIIVVSQDGTRRAYDLYAVAPDAEQMAAQEPVLRHLLNTAMLASVDAKPSDREPPAGWVSFRDETHGFTLWLPRDWAWKEMMMQGPGVPDDWPVVRGVHFYPQAWDAEINHSGPPDPTAKPVVSPVQLEILVGSTEQFRRVYPEPTTSEQVQIGDLQVTIERDIFEPMSITRYVFQSPTNPELYVTLTDQLTGFPDRVAGNEAVAELMTEIVDTFAFVR